ncbi:PcfJ domain-containing protein [Dehalobacterium formicoaceticum]|uniref:PcfJ domain-containing protein n=1 Tax=Dehalobacterium formicoaceticum TaxID=51515 RepID=UPI000B7FDB1C|nr:PcfJ domain-containing protein [Dehalobacterium formicoaceticum]
MLIKREIERTDILEFPNPPPVGGKMSEYVAAVQVLKLKRCGEVLVIDVFRRADEGLLFRFFSDGNTFLITEKWPVERWDKSLSIFLYLEYIEAAEGDIELAHQMLKDKQPPWYYTSGIKNEMTSFIRGINEKKQEQTMERKYSKMTEHFNMFPDYPDDLADYCDTNVFRYTYIFLSKIQKGKREAVCGHCGHKFFVSKDVKPGQNGICPGCEMVAGYRAIWAKGSYKEKSNICITHKFKGQLLIRWTKVVRTFNDTKPIYHFDDYYRNLYLHTSEGPVIYAYDYKPVIHWGENWYRQKNGSVHYGESFVYTNNLKEVFGDFYYHVDLEAGLKDAGSLSFTSLLDNLKNIPAAEYLFKLGMPALAARCDWLEPGNRAGFSEVLGVSKQYLPLYSKFNVTMLEHKIIKAAKTYVSETNFEKLRLLAPKTTDYNDIVDILKNVSFERFVNYFSKQKALNNEKALQYILILYKDYLSMSESLKVDMSRKSVYFPKNIKEAHDLILLRFNKIKYAKEDETFKQNYGKLYYGIKEYKKGDYCIVFPASRSDFIAEGQSLKHCVGVDRYYQNHIAGTKMIFFVRRAREPEKPYYTLEIDMENLKILQLYGFSDRAAPPEVNKFANEFLSRLPVRKDNRIRVATTA